MSRGGMTYSMILLRQSTSRRPGSDDSSPPARMSRVSFVDAGQHEKVGRTYDVNMSVSDHLHEQGESIGQLDAVSAEGERTRTDLDLMTASPIRRL